MRGRWSSGGCCRRGSGGAGGRGRRVEGAEEKRGFLSDLDGAGTNRHLFRAGAPQPTARGHESCSGRPRSAIIGKSTGYSRGAAPSKSKRNPLPARPADSGLVAHVSDAGIGSGAGASGSWGIQYSTSNHQFPREQPTRPGGATVGGENSGFREAGLVHPRREVVGVWGGAGGCQPLNREPLNCCGGACVFGGAGAIIPLNERVRMV